MSEEYHSDCLTSSFPLRIGTDEIRSTETVLTNNSDASEFTTIELSTTGWESGSYEVAIFPSPMTCEERTSVTGHLS